MKASCKFVKAEGQELLILILKDQTEPIKQQRELWRSKESAERANNAKTEFLANMSHELRTPLNAIMGFSEFIKDFENMNLSPEKIKEYSGYILESSNHLLNIINDILDLSKIESQKLKLNEEKFSIEETIDLSKRLIINQLKNSSLTLDISLPSKQIYFFGYPKLFKQILSNLFSNSIKFTPSGGSINLSVMENKNGELKINIEDTGIGMSEEDIEIAMTPFGQIENIGINNET